MILRIITMIGLVAGITWAQAPHVDLRGSWATLDGKKMTLLAKGKPVLLDFWASWCIACRMAVPQVNALQKKYPNLRIVGVNADAPEDFPYAQKFIRDTKMNYPSILDIPEKISGPLEIEGLPTFILLDGEGKELWRSIGEPEDIAVELAPFLLKF